MISPCSTKINLGLEIRGKRPDGYHNLTSIFFGLPFGDLLELELSEESDLKMYGLPVSFSREENIVWKGWQYMQERFSLSHVIWHLYKHVPPGTGIGAGSANLSEMILMSNKLFNLNLSSREMMRISLKFGSDTAFFIKKGSSLVQGRGDMIKPIPNFLEGKYLVLLKPEAVSVSTAEAFSNAVKSEVEQPFEEVIANKGDGFEQLSNNFEGHFYKIYPQLADYRKVLMDLGARYFSLSGSGSCFYAIFDKEPEEKLDETLPILWQGYLGPISGLVGKG